MEAFQIPLKKPFLRDVGSYLPFVGSGSTASSSNQLESCCRTIWRLPSSLSSCGPFLVNPFTDQKSVALRTDVRCVFIP
ncbi:hypothetical protein KCP75_09885 [Salmonella enterica subsp. enterica]|nr:hypothetical protein KCP75_09885 [Salmonella enterica subsp. enterica]